MCYFSDNVSSKENIKILLLIFMFYYSDIIAIKTSNWFFSFTKINYVLLLFIFCVVILCVNWSRSSFILYRIVKGQSRQSNVRRI